MEIYIIMLLLVYVTYFITNNTYRTSEKANKRFLMVSFVIIYLVCALRDYSVGRDIPGYMETYELSSQYPLWDATWIYMEAGYVAYMKICSLLGFSNRMFLFVTYFFMLFPIYYTIKKYSDNPLLSVIIFICFQFLTFDLSGIRQGLATSICLMGFTFALKEGKRNLIIFYLFAILAFLFHRSSIIFMLVPFIVRMKYNTKNIIILLGITAVSPGLTGFIMVINSNNHMSKYGVDDRLAMGGMLVFLFAMALFMIYSSYVNKHRQYKYDNRKAISVNQLTFLVIVSVIFSLAFNGSMLSRSTMFYTIFLLYALPNAISILPKSTRVFCNISFHIGMLLFFYIFCLVPKTLDMVPYKLGTDLPF